MATNYSASGERTSALRQPTSTWQTPPIPEDSIRTLSFPVANLQRNTMDTVQDEISAVYDWQNARRAAISHKGKQALSIRRVQRKRKGQDCEFEPELYVCKEYSLAGVNSAKANGPRYVFGEYKMLRDLSHPNIIDYVDFAYDPDSQVARMYTQYCEFGDLEQALQQRKDEGKLNTLEAVHVMYQTASALLYLHHGVHHTDGTFKIAQFPSIARQGKAPNGWVPLLHRDIKPANIFVAEFTDYHILVKLGDFGIAKTEDDGTATYIGTPAYHAPEQRMEFEGPGKRRTTAKSDIYALGITMQQVTATRSEGLASKTDSAVILDRVIQDCLASNDSERTSSGSIMDRLRPCMDACEVPTMASEILTMITVEAEDLDSERSGRLRAEVASYAELYQRCLGSGSTPSQEALTRFSIYVEGKAFPSWKSQMIRQISTSLQFGKGNEDIRDVAERPEDITDVIDIKSRATDPRFNEDLLRRGASPPQFARSQQGHEGSAKQVLFKDKAEAGAKSQASPTASGRTKITTTNPTGSERSNSEQWRWDQARGMMYRVDLTNRKYVFEDGSSVQFPEQYPETAVYRSEYRKQEDKGHSHMAILQSLIVNYQRTHPTLGWEQAARNVQVILTGHKERRQTPAKTNVGSWP